MFTEILPCSCPPSPSFFPSVFHFIQSLTSFSPIFTECCIHKETHKSSMTRHLYSGSLWEERRGVIFGANQGRISRGHDAVSQYIPHYLLNYLANIFFFFLFSNRNFHTWNVDLHSIILICQKIKRIVWIHMRDKKLAQLGNDQIQMNCNYNKIVYWIYISIQFPNWINWCMKLWSRNNWILGIQIDETETVLTCLCCCRPIKRCLKKSYSSQPTEYGLVM